MISVMYNIPTNISKSLAETFSPTLNVPFDSTPKVPTEFLKTIDLL